MSLTIEEVDRIAKLVRLNFDESEKQKLQHDMSAILEYVEQCKKIEDRAGAADLGQLDGLNLMRDDVAEATTQPEELLKQAPDRDGRFIKVKSVME